MELALTKDEFLTAIDAVREVAATPGKTIVPVLSNILMRANERGIQLEASDLTTSIKTKMDGEIVKPGLITLSAKKLGEIVRELPNKPITIKTTPNYRAKINCGTGSYTIIGESDEDFPKLGNPTDNKVVMDAAIFREMIRKTEYAAAKDIDRYWLNALHVELIENRLEIAATSGPRLSVVSAELEDFDPLGEPLDAIVPLKACSEIKNVFEYSEVLEISTSETEMIFEDEETILSTRLITVKGGYPNYRSVIPQDNDLEFTADREELYKAIKRVSLFSNQKTQSIMFNIEDDELFISGKDQYVGSAEESIDITTNDEKGRSILLSSVYLMEALERIDTDNVEMTFGDHKTCVLMYPEDDRSHTSLMAPMQLVDSDKQAGGRY